MVKKNTTILMIAILLMSGYISAQGSLGRITFSSGGVSSSGLSITMGQSIAGSFKAADGTTLTVGAQAGIQSKETSTTGINQVEIANLVKVYPNPVNAQLNVRLNLEKINGVELSIYDYQGKEVGNYTTFNELTSIDVAHLASGTYTLKVCNEQNQLNYQVKFNKID